MNKPSTPLMRATLAAVASAALLALAACASAPSAPPPDNSSSFSADWREHSKPLFNQGPGISPGTTRWMVSPLLDRGYYRVIARNGNGAELVDTARLKVDDTIGKKIYLMLPMGYTNVELLSEKYITDPKVLADRRGS